MSDIQDKVLGSWFGMAVGDAMGSAVKGLKPETIAQCFQQVDGFKDMRPFIGKGIKQYRMQGLYGSQTQRALVVCDCLLKNRKVDPEVISNLLRQLAQDGPDHYFGLFRHSEGVFRKAVENLPDKAARYRSDQNVSGCAYSTLSIPIALYHQANDPMLMQQCIDTCLLLSNSPWEVTGSALTGFMTNTFLAIEPDDAEKIRPVDILNSAAEFAEQAESHFEKHYPELWNKNDGENARALSRTIRLLSENYLKMTQERLLELICKNASVHVKTTVYHATQGYVLTILPLALVMILKEREDLKTVLTRSLNLGREADKVGAIIGAWAGALYGFSQIPESWRIGLANAREIKARGEALFLRQDQKKLKDIVEMESGLTHKEHDDQKKYVVRDVKKAVPKAAGRIDFDDDELALSKVPRKDDTLKWRKFHKEKSRMKRDRRKNTSEMEE